MNISGNYEKLLEDNLKEELTWLEEEFNFMFKSKRDHYTKEDLNLGSKILDNVIDSIKNNNSEELLNLLAITLNSLEQSYPDFF
jgi:type IV secretory pathway VirB4 component